ncbi:hypothetical protein BJV74DRAFT_838458 [Russula compacta]|nr:hypothetical protein BJV74DRAFT_838458 [Russula compacta]
MNASVGTGTRLNKQTLSRGYTNSNFTGGCFDPTVFLTIEGCQNRIHRSQLVPTRDS